MVEVLSETKPYPHQRQLERALTRLMSELALSDEVTLILVDDDRIRELNRAHRGRDETTDVLSYSLHERLAVDMPEVPHLGDIFISLDTARRQAEANGRTLSEEVMRLAAHGLTHLRGFDHPTEEAWQVFETAQTRILELAAR